MEELLQNISVRKKHCVNNFKVIGIEKTGNGDKIYRETKESLWIKKLKIFEPKHKIGSTLTFHKQNPAKSTS